MFVTYHGLPDGRGVAFEDSIEYRTVEVRTDDPVTPEPADDDRFRFPVDVGCVVTTDGVGIDEFVPVSVRNERGGAQTTLTAHQSASFQYGTYSVQLSGAINLYIQVTAAMSVDVGADYVTVSFDDEGTHEVGLGARSYHDRPAATITTTDEPRDLMRAVSVFSSALKTTSVERSYPTLRGHPPLLERGDELSVPDGLERPNTGVSIVVPPERQYVYQVASLAFYLGATIVPGRPPRVETASGFQYRLDGTEWFEDAVARTLKQSLFLDCIVRTEGLYDIGLYERKRIEPHIPFDLDVLYDVPLRERLPKYLTLDYELIESYVPQWALTAYLPSTPGYAEALPYIVDDLGVVREPRGTRIRNPFESTPEYSRDHSARADGGGEELTRGGEATDGNPGDRHTLVEPTQYDDSIEHAWFGDHIPRGATKATIEAFRNRLNSQPETGTIDITVVCNDREMIEERDGLDDIYGDRYPFELDARIGVDTDELADVLTGGGDFLHYIGHATGDGLECADGALDVRDLNSVSVDTFLLNACQSFEQAIALTRRGAVGGIATLADIENEYAIEMGQVLARLLDLGFPLRGAVDIVRDETALGDQYIVVGDGAVDVVQPASGIPAVSEIESRKDGRYDVAHMVYPNWRATVGAFNQSPLEGLDEAYLHPGRSQTVTIESTPLELYLSTTDYPYRLDGRLRWNQLSAGDDTLNVG